MYDFVISSSIIFGFQSFLMFFLLVSGRYLSPRNPLAMAADIASCLILAAWGFILVFR